MNENIITTNEIAGNLFGKMEFKCPFCNSDKVIDNMEFKRWECKDCRKYFAQPIQIYDEGIPLEKVWVSESYLNNWIERLNQIIGGDGEYDVSNPSEIPYSESFEGSDFEKIQMVLGKVMTHIELIEESIQKEKANTEDDNAK